VPITVNLTIERDKVSRSIRLKISIRHVSSITKAVLIVLKKRESSNLGGFPCQRLMLS